MTHRFVADDRAEWPVARMRAALEVSESGYHAWAGRGPPPAERRRGGNVLDRDFAPPAPDAAWSADITYIPTAEWWLYLAAVEGLFSRMIVGWAMDATMTSRLVVDALEMADSRRLPSEGLLARSDRGSQYASDHHRRALAAAGIACSMSRVAQCWDNAPVEGFFASLKRERVHDERYATREQARASIFECVEVFDNRIRLHSSLGTSPRPSSSGRTTRTARNYDSVFLGEDQIRRKAVSVGRFSRFGR